MENTIVLLIVAAIILIAINTIISFVATRKAANGTPGDFKHKLDSLGLDINRIEASVKSEIAINRSENTESSKSSRQELANSLQKFGEQLANSVRDTSNLQKNQLENFSANLGTLTKTIESKLDLLTTSIDNKLTALSENNTTHFKDSRRELRESLDLFKNDFSKSVNDFNSAQKENFLTLLNKQSDQNSSTAQKLDLMRETIEKKVSELQSGNEKKLEEMRATVDEKLQKTLESRLGESFKLVSERLEAVHKGLGDMQNLAVNVGDLKRVMSNVKSRGILGEYQLHSLLDDLLTNDQYERNVKTKAGSGAIVEFAVKMPNGNNLEKSLWLPIDSKFPKEDYELLVEAYDKADVEVIEDLRKVFVKAIRKCAQDIRDKYIDPPNTTEYGIMFLPFESLYAEVLRTPGLFEQIQKEFKVTITGPTTLSALLNSLQMGFRTLAIEKRSSEVWDLLGAVKTEFGNFGNILDKTQKKLQEANNVIEQAGVRSRAIERKLKNVQELPKEKSSELLGEVLENEA